VNNYLTHTQFKAHPEIPKTHFATSKEFNNLVFTKSLTYMNLSGESIIPSWSYYHKKFQHDYNVSFLVLHDELSKDLGKHQLRFGGNEISSRGHNGLKSIVNHNKHGFKFFRLGVGISRPVSRKADDVANYVLGAMPEEEQITVLYDVLPKISDIILEFVKKQK
jgi:PTH1 family peptidyl-tRNA hydrolase